MSSSDAPDPVELIVGPALQPEMYRCPDCRAIESYAVPLPAGGAACRRCGSRISSGDVVIYAALGTRLVAILIDSLVVGITWFWLFGLISQWSVHYAPKDAEGSVTRTASVWITIALISIAATLVIGYLAAGNARGQTIGKLAIGIKVVLLATGDAPGLFSGTIRTLAQLITVTTLGVGYVILVFDQRRRTLHDRIVHTVVVER